MNLESGTQVNRLQGADILSAKAIAIALERNVVITQCVWDLGEDVGHEHAHRLDIVTATKAVRMYFPDRALLTAGNEYQRERTEDRISRAVAQLVLHAPSPTYGC